MGVSLCPTKFSNTNVIKRNRIITNSTIYHVKILQQTPEGMGRIMNKDEINSFMQEKLNLHLGTVDEKGEPNIQPVWFYHDASTQMIYVSTNKSSKKIQNMRKKSTVYFSIDEDRFPYKCVKGKAEASISEEILKNFPIVEKICLKYNGSLDHPFSKLLIDIAKKGGSLVVQLTPKFYTTWDFSGNNTEQ